MNKKLRGGINVGTSSVLVAFVLLCLVTFAALTYLSAYSDLQLSREVAERTTEYYDANMRAELFMANIEGQLSKKYKLVNSENDFYNSINDIFKDNDSVLVKSDSNNKSIIYMCYQVPINETSELLVELIAHYPDSEDSTLFHINKWCVNTLSLKEE